MGNKLYVRKVYNILMFLPSLEHKSPLRGLAVIETKINVIGLTKFASLRSDFCSQADSNIGWKYVKFQWEMSPSSVVLEHKKTW